MVAGSASADDGEMAVAGVRRFDAPVDAFTGAVLACFGVARSDVALSRLSAVTLCALGDALVVCGTTMVGVAGAVDAMGGITIVGAGATVASGTASCAWAIPAESSSMAEIAMVVRGDTFGCLVMKSKRDETFFRFRQRDEAVVYSCRPDKALQTAVRYSFGVKRIVHLQDRNAQWEVRQPAATHALT